MTTAVYTLRVVAAPPPGTSVLAAAAVAGGSMAVNSFRNVTSSMLGLNQWWKPSGLDIYERSTMFGKDEDFKNLDWAGQTQWAGNGMMIVGGGVGSLWSSDSPSSTSVAGLQSWAIHYDDRTGRWTKYNNPSGVGPGGGCGHTYQHNATDRSRGRHYRLVYKATINNAPMLWEFDTETGNYLGPIGTTGLSGWSVTSGFPGVITWMESADRLICINASAHWIGAWNPVTRLWEKVIDLTGDPTKMERHSVGAYHAGTGSVVYGGGAYNGVAGLNLFRLNSNLTVEFPLTTLPIYNSEQLTLGIGGAPKLLDVGHPTKLWVMFSSAGRLFTLDVTNGAWEYISDLPAYSNSGAVGTLPFSLTQTAACALPPLVSGQGHALIFGAAGSNVGISTPTASTDLVYLYRAF